MWRVRTIFIPSRLYPKTLIVLDSKIAFFYGYLISHSSQFYHRKIFGEQYRSLSSSLCSFLHSPVISSLLGPNILLNTPLSNTLSLRFSLNVSDQVSHPHKKTRIHCRPEYGALS